jgi:hypothetical protein
MNHVGRERGGKSYKLGLLGRLVRVIAGTIDQIEG